MRNRALFDCIVLTAAAILTTTHWTLRTWSAPESLAGADRASLADEERRVEVTLPEPGAVPGDESEAIESSFEQTHGDEAAPKAAPTTATESAVESVEGLPIRGRVRSQTGRLDPREIGPFKVHLWKWVRGERNTSQTVVQWGEAGIGQIEGTFVFDGLSPGPWRLDPYCPGFFIVEPPVVMVDAPAEVEFVVQDAAGWSDLALDVLDDQTGVEIERYRVQARGGLKLADHEFVPFLPAHDGVFAKWWANDLPGTWRVTAEGYLPTDGDLADLLPVRAGDRPRRSATVRLERGAEVVFQCRHADENGKLLPLSDVRVHLDGTLAATTGENGAATIQLRRVPHRVSFVKPGWRPFHAPFDLETGVLDDLRAMEYYVVFERDE